jgi:hypothetical protein
MPIYELDTHTLVPLPPLATSAIRLHAEQPFQRVSRYYLHAIAPDTLVISSEYFQSDKSGHGVLAIDKQANLVLVQFKEDNLGAQMELRALRLATLASSLTFARVITLYGEYLRSIESAADPTVSVLRFLGWEEADDARFGLDVRVVLVSAEFSADVASAVIWLNEHGLDIRCIRLQPYLWNKRVLLDIQQVLPNTEVPGFQDQLRRRERAARASDLTKYNVKLGGVEHEKLASRWAIWHSIKNLVDAGVSPCLQQVVLKSSLVVKDGTYIGRNGAAIERPEGAGGG